MLGEKGINIGEDEQMLRSKLLDSILDIAPLK